MQKSTKRVVGWGAGMGIGAALLVLIAVLVMMMTAKPAAQGDADMAADHGTVQEAGEDIHVNE